MCDRFEDSFSRSEVERKLGITWKEKDFLISVLVVRVAEKPDWYGSLVRDIMKKFGWEKEFDKTMDIYLYPVQDNTSETLEE